MTSNETQSREALLPCPFCGSTDLCLDDLGGGDSWHIECNGCDMSQHAVHTELGAITAWNTRAALQFAGRESGDGDVLRIIDQTINCLNSPAIDIEDYAFDPVQTAVSNLTYLRGVIATQTPAKTVQGLGESEWVETVFKILWADFSRGWGSSPIYNMSYGADIERGKARLAEAYRALLASGGVQGENNCEHGRPKDIRCPACIKTI